MRAFVVASLSLVILTSMNHAQTPPGQTQPGQGSTNVTPGNPTQGNPVQGMPDNGAGAMPVRGVDGNYVILAFERFGNPIGTGANRTVVIRNNIMTITTGDTSAPTKMFSLRFLPNNMIQLVELDPRNPTSPGTVNTGSTSGGTTGTPVTPGGAAAGTTTAPATGAGLINGQPPGAGIDPQGRARMTPGGAGVSRSGAGLINGRPPGSGVDPQGRALLGPGSGTTTPGAAGNPAQGSAAGTPGQGGATTTDETGLNRGVDHGVYVLSSEFFAISIFAHSPGNPGVNPVQPGVPPRVPMNQSPSRTGTTTQGPNTPGSASTVTGTPSINPAPPGTGATGTQPGNTGTTIPGSTAAGTPAQTDANMGMPGNGAGTEQKLVTLVLRRVS